MKPLVGQKVKFRKDEGVVEAFYEENGFYKLNIRCKDYTDSWTRLEEKDLEEIKIV